MAAEVTLRPWSADDLPVLEQTNAPDMTTHLGGPETPEKLRDRHERYQRGWTDGVAWMFTVHTAEEPDPVGIVGFWNTTHEGHDVFECAYAIVPAFQGRGLAGAATLACLEYAATHGTRDDVYAFPNVTNSPSNALCERVGFELEGEQDFEYPKGHPIRANAWRYRLSRLR